MPADVMTTSHPKWEDFETRLGGPEGCNLRKRDGQEWISDCKHEHVFSVSILQEMGFDDDSVQASLEHFKANGGYCDCEILFNVAVDSARP